MLSIVAFLYEIAVCTQKEETNPALLVADNGSTTHITSFRNSESDNFIYKLAATSADAGKTLIHTIILLTAKIK